MQLVPVGGAGGRVRVHVGAGGHVWGQGVMYDGKGGGGGGGGGGGRGSCMRAEGHITGSMYTHIHLHTPAQADTHTHIHTYKYSRSFRSTYTPYMYINLWSAQPLTHT